jgi:hypothetical protein
MPSAHSGRWPGTASPTAGTTGAIARWCCSPLSRACAGVRSPRYANVTSTWPVASCTSGRPTPTAANLEARSSWPAQIAGRQAHCWHPHCHPATAGRAPGRVRGARPRCPGLCWRHRVTASTQQLQQDVGPEVRHGGVGAARLHLHDLRHTANHFAASTGAGLKDLMAGMGHDSERAAMIYLHETRGADPTITAAIDDHFNSTREKDARGRCETR